MKYLLRSVLRHYSFLKREKRFSGLPLPFTALMLLICVSTATISQGEIKSEAGQTFIYANPPHIKQYLGNWSGTLTYLDYTSQRRVIIKATIDVKEDSSDKNKVILAYDYPNEPGHGEKETIEIRGDDLFIEGHPVTMEKSTGGDSLSFVLEQEGRDSNRRATIRRTFQFDGNIFSIKKEVRNDGALIFFIRNEYNMVRQ